MFLADTVCRISHLQTAEVVRFPDSHRKEPPLFALTFAFFLIPSLLHPLNFPTISLQCSGSVERFGPIILSVLYNRTLNPEWTCQALGFCGPQLRPTSVPFNLPKSSPLSSPPNGVPKLPLGVNPGTLQGSFFLHLTDVHYDPNYT